MIILGIETSCDETAAAVLQKTGNRITILSNIVSSSASLQAKFGGIIPEQAAREQIKAIIPVIETALNEVFSKSRLPRPSASLRTRNDGVGIDAIAVTFGPGLIGSLLVGVETAKTLAKIWNKPLIPVNHLIGHFYANWINTSIPHIDYRISIKQHDRRLTINDEPKFPCLGLLVSGGHTDLVLFKDHNKYEYLGGTRDDAAGECFDKCARLLNLPYPGGPEISKLAKKGNPDKFKLPIPMQGRKDLDFSYSGLKTAVANLIHTSPIILSEAKNFKINKKESGDPSSLIAPQDDNTLADLAASIEDTIVKSLIEKVVLAIQEYKIENIMIAGGVAANEKLQKDLGSRIKDLGLNIKVHIPKPQLCTDNGAMIASAAFFQKPIKNPLNLQANPNLSLSD